MSAVTPKGTLYLVPTPLDFGCDAQAAITDVLPQKTLYVAAGVTHWITENAKSTRAFLKRVDAHVALANTIQENTITELPREVHKKGDHTGEFDAKPMLKAALAGHDVGLVSEAGMPAVADPGSSVVRAAHELGIRVVPLVGPVSLLLALAASGLNGQNFAFVGYLPQDSAARSQRLRELESLAAKHKQTQLFIETPYRNQAVWEALVNGLQGTTRLARASGLTMDTMQVHCKTVQAWRSAGKVEISSEPTVFLIGN
ncbi:SAM-dependent methyltransferase [Limnohabitans sp.]|uniref:SAM-dependent methyltransferase n=1 Tax=Limnohabitans sp. TaxID=1907725 RepID=UPI002FDD4A8A